MFTFFTSGIEWMKEYFHSFLLYLLCLHCLNISCSNVKMLQFGVYCSCLYTDIVGKTHTGWKGVTYCWRSKSRSPKLWKSAIIGVIYRSHCSPISIYQLLCNVSGLLWFTGRMWPQCSIIHFVHHLNDWHQVLTVCVFCFCCIMILVESFLVFFFFLE